mgnify:FL=1
MRHGFEETLDKFKDKVWQTVIPYLADADYPDAFKIPIKYSALVRNQWEIIGEYPKRKGKYIRPVLVILTAQALGVPESQVLQTAAAMQVSEDWLLIHDDFEDDSEFRRGKPALHKLYGANLAVNAGDLLHVIMWKILLDNRGIVGDEKCFQLSNEFYTMLTRTSLGQGVELDLSQGAVFDLSDQDWFFIADGKTGYYSLAAPMRLGAIIAGASARQLSLLADFGRLLGRCFQLRDDILDLTSDFRGLKGQVQYNDIYEGKRTLILGHLLRTASPSDKRKAVGILSKSRQEKTEEEVRWMVDKISHYGSLAYSQSLAEQIAGQARKMLESKLNFLHTGPKQSNLHELISFIIEREY